MCVVRTLEVCAVGVFSAIVIVPGNEEEPFAACLPLLADGRHASTLGECNKFLWGVILEELVAGVTVQG